MSKLYRVLTLANWEEAKAKGVVARCGNDHKADGVNLNLPEAVNYTASKYFTPVEKPVLLEVDTTEFSDHIEWRHAIENEPWLRPLARINGIPVDCVVSVTSIDPKLLNG